MTMIKVDGKKLAADIRANVAKQVSDIKKQGGSLFFVAVQVGDDPASNIYIETKRKNCKEVGIKMQVIKLPASTTQDTLNNTLAKISKRKSVCGILLQLPLPKHLDSCAAVENITPYKDVDGLTLASFGRLAAGGDIALAPCTALGVLHILKKHSINLTGANAVVIGRSNIVGKPTAMLLQKENATVTVCHSHTKDLKLYTKKADVVVVAAGRRGILTGEMIKKGAAVIDVGINRIEGKIYGDVDYDSVAKKAKLLTPVPGGVGPLTVAFLLKNIVSAYELSLKEG